MSKTFKYVKDFDFSSAGKTVGYCSGGMVAKKANGGVVGRAISKGNTVSNIGRQEAAVMKSRMIPEGSGMVKDTSSLGIKGNKNPGVKSASRPVAPKLPGMPAKYRNGGHVKAKRYDDGGEVIAEPVATTMASPSATTPATASPLTREAWKQQMQEWKATRPDRPEGMRDREARQEWRNTMEEWKATRPEKPDFGKPDRGMRPDRVDRPRPAMSDLMGAFRNRFKGFNSTPLVNAQTPALRKGGAVPKAGAYKVPKVMSEFKSGELHSGSKTGPLVKSRKQAVAIALNEARHAGKKK